MSTAPVFHADPLPDGGELVLDGPEGRHAAAVRRLRAGEELLLTDGRGGLAACTVRAAESASLRLAITRRWHEPAPALTVTLVQALVKGDRGELAVELATEAGVDRIVPWRAARCVARWDDGARGAKALARWRSTAGAAAKQARRPWLPPVTDPVDTRSLNELVGAAAGAVVLHESAQTALTGVPLPASGELLLVVGPEGGITDDELASLLAAGASVARLGPSVLRASTAAAVALGALGALTGRWKTSPPDVHA